MFRSRTLSAKRKSSSFSRWQRAIWEFWKWPLAVRYNRMGRFVNSENLASLEARLSHSFANRELLHARAFPHASVGSDSNERLEFLGDACSD